MGRIRTFIHPLELVCFDEHSCHLLLRLRHAGRNLHFVVDTGATMSLLDSAAVGEWECAPCQGKALGLNGSLEAMAVTEVVGMRMGRYRLPPIPFVVGDMGGVVALYREMTRRRIVGLIGGNALLEWNAVIDYQTQTITVELP